MDIVKYTSFILSFNFYFHNIYHIILNNILLILNNKLKIVSITKIADYNRNGFCDEK